VCTRCAWLQAEIITTGNGSVRVSGSVALQLLAYVQILWQLQTLSQTALGLSMSTGFQPKNPACSFE
jgi:hypothetical protein